MNFPMPLAPAGLLAISGYANDADLRAAAAEILTEGGCRLYLPAVISQ